MVRKVRKVAKGKGAEPGTNKQGEAQRHKQELQAIKEKDPEFYRFLIEEDQQLLDFTADADAESDEDDKDGERANVPDKEKGKSSESSRVLTLERFQQIQSSARTSMTAFKAVAHAYHLAVRSISAEEESKDQDKDNKEDNMQRSSSSTARRRRRSMTIDNEATFSAILEWGLENFLELLEHHAAEGEAKDATRTHDATRLPRWKRVKVMSQIFWDETLFLLINAQNAEMQEAVLRTCSSARALAWLWPFKNLQRKYLKTCLQIWTQPKAANASASSTSPRLLSFLFLRNAAAMTLLKDGLSLEDLLRAVLRAFMGATSSYTWRSLNSVRFMENCILELFRLDDAAAYRAGYVCIRQLALVLRNASLKPVAAAKGATGKAKAKSKAATKGSKASKFHKVAKTTKGKAKAKSKIAEALVSWPYVRAMFLWTRLVSEVKALKDLAYPLYMVILGAVKSQSSLNFAPFCMHGLRALNELAEKTQKLVPLSALLLRLLDMNLKAIDKAPKGSQEDTEEVHLEVLLALPTLKEESLTKLGSCICALFTEHLGLLSRSVAFPELAAPVLLHLRRFSKHCRAEALRKQLKGLISFVEETRDQVQRFREQLRFHMRRVKDPPPAGQLFVVDATSLTRQRALLQKRRAEHEKKSVQAESDAKRQKRPKM